MFGYAHLVFSKLVVEARSDTGSRPMISKVFLNALADIKRLVGANTAV